MKMATMDSKYIQHLRKISAVLLRLISRTLKLFPFGLVMVPVILFYFAPDSFLAEIIHEWKKADISEGDIYMCVYGCFSQLSFF